MKKIHVLSCLILLSLKIAAQHEHPVSDSARAGMNMIMPPDSMKEMRVDEMNMEMNSSFSPGLPMSRDGSGTSWQPDDSPVMMYMKMHGRTTFMAHGFIFLRYNSQDIFNESSRGGDRFDAPDMFMLMLQHKMNDKNLFALHTMLSLDPVTIGEAGYPLLFQTGESYKNIPLVDRQHPHDLFSEIAVSYAHAFSKDMDVIIYAGYPGEPALGPVVFMHRISAMNNPNAPLGHHWQDATHITFGVGTLGLRYKIFKLEGSIFTGREPDENRYDFDAATFDSYSYRLSVNPEKHLAFQFSQGFIKSPEALFPLEDIVRTTASIIHTKVLQNKRYISSTIIWGMNSVGHENFHSLLAESNARLRYFTVYARYEYVKKDARELQLLHFEQHASFDIQAITLGLNKNLFTYFNTDLSLGIQGTINFPEDRLKSVYGNNPLAASVFLKMAPSVSNH
jgi:hypothetical protein